MQYAVTISNGASHNILDTVVTGEGAVEELIKDWAPKATPYQDTRWTPSNYELIDAESRVRVRVRGLPPIMQKTIVASGPGEFDDRVNDFNAWLEHHGYVAVTQQNEVTSGDGKAYDTTPGMGVGYHRVAMVNYYCCTILYRTN